jgi:uncharacterized membrane protein YdjX (TVP38/TMEM64 family)
VGEISVPKRDWLIRNRTWLVPSPLALVVLAVGAWLTSDSVRHQTNAAWRLIHLEDGEALREYLEALGSWAPLVSILMMVLQALVAPVPLSVIALANGLVFGVAGGTIISVVGYIVGALLSFAIARTFGRTTVERMMGKANQRFPVAKWLDRYGIWALFLVRLLPGMPSDLMSFVAGLGRMSVTTYVTVTIAGFLPQAFLYALVGDQALRYVWLIFAGSAAITGIIGGWLWWQNRREATPAPSP